MTRQAFHGTHGRVNRRWFIRQATAALALLTGCTGSPPRSQQDRLPIVGFVTAAASPLYYTAFVAGLAEYGWVEGQNVLLDVRSGEGQESRLPAIIADLVSRPVDILVAVGPPVVRDAVHATRTIPIVMVNISDPVEQGWVASLERPGANATGVANNSQWLAGQRLQLLQEAAAPISRIVVPTVPGNTTSTSGLRQLDLAAQALGLQLLYASVAAPDDFLSAIVGAIEDGAGALYMLPYALLLANAKHLLDIATVYRLPAVCDRRGCVQAGALLSYGPDEGIIARRAGYYADRVLQGVQPGDLPIEQPFQFELIINLKAAQALGLTVPDHLLIDATELIQ